MGLAYILHSAGIQANWATAGLRRVDEPAKGAPWERPTDAGTEPQFPSPAAKLVPQPRGSQGHVDPPLFQLLGRWGWLGEQG